MKNHKDSKFTEILLDKQNFKLLTSGLNKHRVSAIILCLFKI